jgi:DNA-binding transcriptional MerR regulator
MTYWQTKQLAELAKVSVRTLHHYDKIGLLSPSLRADNGYRLYTEKDLFTLQQIIALKALGFELGNIQKILVQSVNVKETLMMQADLLEQKAKNLSEAAEFIQHTLNRLEENKSFDWKLITQLLEVFTMTQQLENQWVTNVLQGEELEQYAKFEAQKRQNYSESKRKAFDAEWADIVLGIKQHMNEEPTTKDAISLGKRTMDIINPLYGPDNANIKNKLWHEGFKKGKNQQSHGITAEMANWLDKAIDAYWQSRIYPMLAKVSSVNDDSMRQAWLSILDEMCGNDTNSKRDVYAIAKKDNTLSADAKKWLQKVEKQTLEN